MLYRPLLEHSYRAPDAAISLPAEQESAVLELLREKGLEAYDSAMM
jgi:hypothetical protein